MIWFPVWRQRNKSEASLFPLIFTFNPSGAVEADQQLFLYHCVSQKYHNLNRVRWPAKYQFPDLYCFPLTPKIVSLYAAHPQPSYLFAEPKVFPAIIGCSPSGNLCGIEKGPKVAPGEARNKWRRRIVFIALIWHQPR